MKLIYLLALPLLAFTADTWQPFAFDQHVSVQLPAKASEMTKEETGELPAGTHMFVAVAGGEAYQLTTGLVPAALKTQDARARGIFFDGIVKGLVQEQGNKLLSRKSFSTTAGDGLAVAYESPATSDSKAMIIFSRAFVVNRNSYILTFMQVDGDSTNGVARRRFFNSITVKP